VVGGGGERFLHRVTPAATTGAGGKPFLVANAPEAAKWRDDVEVVRDVRQACGSLGGILTALTHAREPVLVAAWDMPFLTPDLVQALVAACDGYDVFLPASTGPLGVEPLVGVYTPACLPAIERSIEGEDLRMTAFHGDVRVGTLPLDAVQALGHPATLFFNVNTAEELETAAETWRALHGATP
jgi:molybdopterin-guanine dinucleotide biosynthesis protein A